MTLLLLCTSALADGPPVVCQRASAAPTTLAPLVARRSAPCPANYEQARGAAGANLFDILWVSSTGMNATAASAADALEALRSASVAGVRFFRFFAVLWGE